MQPPPYSTVPPQPTAPPGAAAYGYPQPPQPQSYPHPQSGYQSGPYQPQSGYSATYDPSDYERGRSYSDEEDERGGPFAGRSFDDTNIRRAFIRKVFMILFTQLLITAVIVSIFLTIKPVQVWVQKHKAIYFVAFGVFFVTYICLLCCGNIRRSYPCNFICLLIFTLAFSYMTAMITSYHKTESVLIALGITCVVCLGVTLFALQTKIDFTLCSGVIFVFALVFFVFGIVTIIVYKTAGYNHVLNCVYGGVGALLFSLFFVINIQMIVGGHSIELSPEEYVFAAIQLYINIVEIFILILSCFEKARQGS